MREKNKILVIKHGALGDFILSLGPFKAIRNHHLNDNIVLLTTSPYKGFAEESKYFNEVIIDDSQYGDLYMIRWENKSPVLSITFVGDKNSDE